MNAPRKRGRPRKNEPIFRIRSPDTPPRRPSMLDEVFADGLAKSEAKLKKRRGYGPGVGLELCERLEYGDQYLSKFEQEEDERKLADSLDKRAEYGKRGGANGKTAIIPPWKVALDRQEGLIRQKIENGKSLSCIWLSIRKNWDHKDGPKPSTRSLYNWANAKKIAKTHISEK